MLEFCPPWDKDKDEDEDEDVVPLVQGCKHNLPLLFLMSTWLPATSISSIDMEVMSFLCHNHCCCRQFSFVLLAVLNVFLSILLLTYKTRRNSWIAHCLAFFPHVICCSQQSTIQDNILPSKEHRVSLFKNTHMAIAAANRQKLMLEQIMLIARPDLQQQKFIEETNKAEMQHKGNQQ